MLLDALWNYQEAIRGEKLVWNYFLNSYSVPIKYFRCHASAHVLKLWIRDQRRILRVSLFHSQAAGAHTRQKPENLLFELLYNNKSIESWLHQYSGRFINLILIYLKIFYNKIFLYCILSLQKDELLLPSFLIYSLNEALKFGNIIAKVIHPSRQ